jgi:hypothetical protein
VHRALVPGGQFVFSIEHPIYMAPQSRVGPSTPMARGHGLWTIGTTLNLLIKVGFQLTHVEEFCPTAEQIADRPRVGRGARAADISFGGRLSINQPPFVASRAWRLLTS